MVTNFEPISRDALAQSVERLWKGPGSVQLCWLIWRGFETRPCHKVVEKLILAGPSGVKTNNNAWNLMVRIRNV